VPRAHDDRHVREGVADVLRPGAARRCSRRRILARPWRSLNGDSIALLIADLVMPELNGFPLADLLRSSQPAVKALFGGLPLPFRRWP